MEAAADTAAQADTAAANHMAEDPKKDTNSPAESESSIQMGIVAGSIGQHSLPITTHALALFICILIYI